MHLSGLSSLSSLTLGHHTHHEFLCNGLPHLRDLPALTSLDIHDAELNSFLATSMPTQLQHLGLECCFPPEEGANMETTRTLATIAERCPGLTTIDLAFNDTVSLEGLAQLNRLTGLRRILLDDESTLFAPLAELPPVLNALFKVWPSHVAHHPWYHRERMPGTTRSAAAAVARLCATLTSTSNPPPPPPP